MSSADSERDRVAMNLLATFATPREIPFGFAPAVRVRFVRDTTLANRTYPCKVEFEFGSKRMSTWFAFQEFSDRSFDDAYGLAVQNPLNRGAKFSRLSVEIIESRGIRCHEAGGTVFKLGTSEFAEPARVRDLLANLGHGSETPYKLWQCDHPFDVLQPEGIARGMLEFLRFTLVLMCFRWTDKTRGIRFREVSSLGLLAALGAKLDDLSRGDS
jgi:hypothetical protein